jgi:hypothetical protein
LTDSDILSYLSFQTGLFLCPPLAHGHGMLTLNRMGNACASKSADSRCRHGQALTLWTAAENDVVAIAVKLVLSNILQQKKG